MVSKPIFLKGYNCFPNDFIDKPGSGVIFKELSRYWLYNSFFPFFLWWGQGNYYGFLILCLLPHKSLWSESALQMSIWPNKTLDFHGGSNQEESLNSFHLQLRFTFVVFCAWDFVNTCCKLIRQKAWPKLNRLGDQLMSDCPLQSW